MTVDTPIKIKIINKLNWPDEAGLRVRPFRGAADFSRMVEIINARNAINEVEEVMSVDELANEYAHLQNCDPLLDMVFIEKGELLIAFGGIEWRIDDEGQRRFDSEVQIDPAWKHLGLMRPLYLFCEERARQLTLSDPMNNISSYINTWLPEQAQSETRLVESLGYQSVRHFFTMQHNLRQLPDMPLPAGIEIRPVQKPDHLRPIWDTKEAAFADHWGHAQRNEEDFQRWCKTPTFEHNLWQVAWDVSNNSVAGVSINSIYYEDNKHYGFQRGWIDTLGVRREWRGRGLAKALLVRSLRLLKGKGMAEGMLGVDASNPTGALQLYEKVGFSVYKRSRVWRKTIVSHESQVMNQES